MKMADKNRYSNYIITELSENSFLSPLRISLLPEGDLAVAIGHRRRQVTEEYEAMLSEF